MLQDSAQEGVITRDIHRTFPAHDYFKDSDGDGQDSLYKICKVSLRNIILKMLKDILLATAFSVYHQHILNLMKFSTGLYSTVCYLPFYGFVEQKANL